MSYLKSLTNYGLKEGEDSEEKDGEDGTKKKVKFDDGGSDDDKDKESINLSMESATNRE